MKILILNHNLRERGTYFRAREIARGLHARGHDITFVNTGTGFYRARSVERAERWHHWESANWSILREPGEGFSPLGLLQRILSLREKWDLIYTFSHTPVDQGAARLLRRKGTFWMTDWCDLWDSQGGGLHDITQWSEPLPAFTRGLRGYLTRMSFRAEDAMERDAALDADAVSIIVEATRVYTRALGIPDDAVLHLVSGADTARISPLDPKACREKLSLPTDRIIVGHIANVTPDTALLSAAMQIVWQKIPDLLMISVGPRWYDEAGPMSAAKNNGRLVDFGFRPFSEIPTFLGASDFMVMPLRDLPFNRCRWPNKFGDHMAAGRATASNRVGDMATIIDRYNVGRAGQPTAEGLAESILALAQDPALRAQCGRNARTLAESEIAWSRQIDRLVSFLKFKGLDL